MRPVIGIPCYSGERAGNLRPLFGNNQSYVCAVYRAGGAPLLLTRPLLPLLRSGPGLDSAPPAPNADPAPAWSASAIGGAAEMFLLRDRTAPRPLT